MPGPTRTFTKLMPQPQPGRPTPVRRPPPPNMPGRRPRRDEIPGERPIPPNRDKPVPLMD